MKISLNLPSDLDEWAQTSDVLELAGEDMHGFPSDVARDERLRHEDGDEA